MTEFLWQLARNSLWMSACLLGALALCRWTGFPAKWKHMALVLVLAGFMLPVRPALTRQAELPLPTLPVLQGEAGARGEAEMPLAVRVAEVKVAGHISAGQALFGLWLAGAFLVFLRRLGKYAALRRHVRRWAYPAPAWREEKPTVLLCPGVRSPFLMGLLRPRIVLPEEGFMPGETEWILRHERAHWKRGDLWTGCIGMLAAAVNWFNPLLPLAEAACAAQAEMAADDVTVQGEADCSGYARLILRCAGAAVPLTTRLGGGKKDMKRRMENLFGRSAKRGGFCLALVVVLAIAGMPGVALSADTVGSLPEPPGTWLTSVSEVAAEGWETLLSRLSRHVDIETPDLSMQNAALGQIDLLQARDDDILRAILMLESCELHAPIVAELARMQVDADSLWAAALLCDWNLKQNLQIAAGERNDLDVLLYTQECLHVWANGSGLDRLDLWLRIMETGRQGCDYVEGRDSLLYEDDRYRLFSLRAEIEGKISDAVLCLYKKESDSQLWLASVPDCESMEYIASGDGWVDIRIDEEERRVDLKLGILLEEE